MSKRFGPLFALLVAVGSLQATVPIVTSVVNAAPDSVRTCGVARGELISVYGSNLANSVDSNFTPAAPIFSLAGASVTIGGLAAPIVYASPTQLDVQVPFEIAAGIDRKSVV